MLADLTLAMCGRAGQVSALARNAARLNALASRRQNLTPLVCDYSRTQALRDTLANVCRERGPIDLAICWVHAHAADAMDTIAAALAPGATVVHVRSSEGQASGADDADGRLRARHRALRWQVVRLGFKLDLSGGQPRARWLTHAEICAGVLDAVENGAVSTVVGLVPSREAPGPGGR